ncbi:MAG: hypothetical protein AAF725_26960, partial [Acidobacteriota bacterium]
MSDDNEEVYRIRAPLTVEEKRKRLLARRRYERRFKKIDFEKKRRPQFVMVLLSVLAIALVLYQIFGPGLLPEQGAGSAAGPAAAEGTAASIGAGAVRVDAEPFRAQVESFEGALLGSSGGQGGDLVELSSNLTLSARLLIDR